MSQSIRLPMTEPSQVGQARRQAAVVSGLLGFSETEAGKLALIVTEAATNVLKHAGQGELLLRCLEDGAARGVEVLALDQGPGMADLERCLQDGYSSRGSPGTGLGAIARLSSVAAVQSTPEHGTVLLARLWASAPPGGLPEVEVGAVNVCYPGESECGDGWLVLGGHGRHLVLVADGLGHGRQAAAAARTAVQLAQAHAHLGPAELLQLLHPALRSTRGAAVGIAALDLPARTVRFAGVGNVAATILTGGVTRSLVSHNGTVGMELRKVQEFAYPFPDGALLVMHSDGLISHWKLDGYPGLTQAHPALVAGVLYRDFKRGRDDVTVVAVRAPFGDGQPS